VRLKLPRGLVRYGVGPLVTGLAATWRIQVLHQERWDDAIAAGGPRLVFLWHETLLPLLWHHRHREVSVVVSRARDGQYLVDYATRLGYQVIEGSSHRGRVGAMRGTLRTLEAGGLVAITPDGPRGPRRVVKPGGLVAAQAVGATVFTAHAAARPSRRLGSWDRFLVPAPFARVRIGYGPAFRVREGPEGLDEALVRVTADLAHLAKEIGWPEATPTD